MRIGNTRKPVISRALCTKVSPDTGKRFSLLTIGKFLKKSPAKLWQPGITHYEIPDCRSRFHRAAPFRQPAHPGSKRCIALPDTRSLYEGVIGRSLSVRSHWGEYLPDWHPWEDYRSGYSARPDLGGGVILTLCHPLDYLRWMLGEVSDLWAFTGQLSDMEIQVEDVAEIGLRFANGVLGSIHLDFFQHPPSHHLEIIGTSGTIKWDNSDGVVRVYQTEIQEFH